ncbi:MAG: hypothetical protein ACKO24_05185 [Leptolyngbyaceae cyanobacterium]
MIDHFLLTLHRSDLEAYVQQAADLPKNSQTRGFIRIAENLQDILKKGAIACSCRRCEQIGDVVKVTPLPAPLRSGREVASRRHPTDRDRVKRA